MKSFLDSALRFIKNKDFYIAGLIGVCVYALNTQQRVVTVDRDRCVEALKERLVSLPQDTIKVETRRLYQQFQACVQTLGHENHWVILDQQDVLSGAIDRTEEVLHKCRF